MMIFSTLVYHNDPTRLIAWCGIGIVAGLYLFFNGFRLLQRRRLILDTPLSKIRSAALGMVELNGLAAGPYTIAAPITSRQCYFYRTIVWEWKRQGRSSQWVRVIGECSHVPFFLDDNTGKVLVDPRGAELDLHCDFREEFCDSFFSLKQDAPPNVHALLSRHGLVTSNKIKVEEFCIKPKNALFLVGTLTENRGFTVSAQAIIDDEYTTRTSQDALWFNPVSTISQTAPSFVSNGGEAAAKEKSISEGLLGGSFQAPDFHSSPFARFSLGKSILEEESNRAASTQVIQLSPNRNPVAATEMTQQQKVATALIKAGISNPAAWAAAGVMNAAHEVHSDDSSHNGFDPHPPVVLIKGKNDSTFLISWRSQREIARSLGWKCVLMTWGGPILSLLCLYALLQLIRTI